MEQYLKMDLKVIKLDNFEVGVNILMPFPVFPFLQKNLILCKFRAFKEYDPDGDGIILGYHCDFGQYQLKIYDKGLQFNLPYNLMRVELRYKKMEIPNRYGVYNLADLRNKEIVYGFKRLLLEAWENVLLYDYDIDLNNQKLSKFQRDLLMNGKDRTHWLVLKNKNKRTFNDHRQKFRALVLEYGNNYHFDINEKIKNEWDSLINNQSTLLISNEKEMYKLTNMVKCQNVHFRTCSSCGKDISHQRKGSKFCSEKYVGKIASKHCRNIDSNPRNNLNRYKENINRHGVLFDITPYIVPRGGKGRKIA